MDRSRAAGWYLEIAREFGYPAAAEAAAADELRALLPPRAWADPEGQLRSRIDGREAILVGLAPGGGAPPIHALPVIGRARVVIAADGAAERCSRAGLVPEVIVTDLDGPVPVEVEANARGAFVVVHAHGDNRPALARWVPEFPGPIAGTWAGAPAAPLLNFGGFTDGDRAAYLAEALGATHLHLFGFDFVRVDEPDPLTAARKRRKLAWARKLLLDLAERGRAPVTAYRPDGTAVAVQELEATEDPTGPSIQ